MPLQDSALWLCVLLYRQKYQKLPTRIIGANSITSTNHYKRSSYDWYIFTN